MKTINIIAVCIGLVLLLIYFNDGCEKPGGPITRIETFYDTIPGDSIPYPVMVKVPYPVYIDSIVEIPADVDTLSILKDYFSTKYYRDTITDDTSMFVIIIDTIGQNRIIGRGALFQNLREKAIITTNIYKDTDTKNKFLIGGYAGFNKDQSVFGIGAQLVNKKDHIIGYSWFPGQQMHLVNYHVKLRLGKR